MKNIFNEITTELFNPWNNSYEFILNKKINDVNQALYYISLIKNKHKWIHISFYKNDKFIEMWRFYSLNDIMKKDLNNCLLSMGINNRFQYLDFMFKTNKIIKYDGTRISFNKVVITIKKSIKI